MTFWAVRMPSLWLHEIAMVEGDTGEIALKPDWEGPVRRARHRGLYLGRWKLLELPTPDGVRVCLPRGRRCVLIRSNDVRAEPAYPHLVRFVLGEAGVPWDWEYGDMVFWDGR